MNIWMKINKLEEFQIKLFSRIKVQIFVEAFCRCKFWNVCRLKIIIFSPTVLINSGVWHGLNVHIVGHPIRSWAKNTHAIKNWGIRFIHHKQCKDA